jgi:hypothetical protein
MVVNIFFWALLRLSRSPSGLSYNWLDVDRQFIWVWWWLSRSPSGPSNIWLVVDQNINRLQRLNGCGTL